MQLPFAVEMWAHTGQITNTAWKNTCGPRCQHNFNSGILASGKTRIAPKTSKTTNAWWLATNSKTMPVAMKCQITTQLKPDLSQHKPGWPWVKLLADYNFIFFALYDLYSGSCPKVVILRQLPFSVEMWAQTGQITNTAWKNTCGTLPAQLQQWHPSLPVARLGWLPELPLHDGWQRTRKLCHCSWNVKSTIRKAKLPQHKPGSPWENCSLITTSQLHFFALHNLYLGPF